jgi:hypothetical protein
LFAELAVALAIAGLGLSRLVPLLAKPAKSAAESLQQVGIGLLDYIARFLTWLFRPRQARRMDIGESSSRIMGEPPPPMADETSVFGTIVVWLVLVLAAAFSIALLGYLFFLLFTWLGKKVDARKVERNASGFVKWPKRSAQGKFLSNSAAMRAYRILLRRGKAVRMQRKSSETPREYATRLAMAFPKSTKGAEILVLCVEREVYGNLLPSEKESIILRDIASRIRIWSFSAEKIGRILRKLGDKRHFRHSKPGSILDQ